jgi:hypothetical protein
MRRSWHALLLATAGAVVGALACGEPDATETDEATEATEPPESPESPESPDSPEGAEATGTTEAPETGEAEAPAAEPAAPVGREPRSEAERRALARARDAGQYLGRTLKTRLMTAMAEGPGEAIRVCSQEAQQLTAQAAEAQDARVGRSSTKLRNPENAGPQWVDAWLEAHGDRPAAEVGPASGIGGDPPAARFVAPIAMQGPCLMCHGDPAGIPEEVRAVLRERYPQDQATGYEAGDLRGAVWAEVPLAPAE